MSRPLTVSRPIGCSQLIPPNEPAGRSGMTGFIRSWWNSLGGPPVILTMSGASSATTTRKMMNMPPASATLSRRSLPQAIWLSERPSMPCSPSCTRSVLATLMLGSSNVLRVGLPGSQVRCRPPWVRRSDQTSGPGAVLVKDPCAPLPNRDRATSTGGPVPAYVQCPLGVVRRACSARSASYGVHAVPAQRRTACVQCPLGEVSRRRRRRSRRGAGAGPTRRRRRGPGPAGPR